MFSVTADSIKNLKLKGLLSSLPGIKSSGENTSASYQPTLNGKLSVVGAEDKYSDLVSLSGSGEIVRQRLFRVLDELAFDAMNYGARELYIGHPREYRYEFFVDDRGYQGVIEPSDYFGLLKLFGDEPELEIEVDWPDVESIQLSLTSNYLNPVIHVSWRYRWLDQHIEDSVDSGVII